MEQAPCPSRILDDIGGAFSMGAIGGGVWYAIKGMRTSPRGQKFIGSVHLVKLRSPVLAGNFGIWGALFSTYDCTFLHLRGKEDPFNAILSGFFTGGTLAIRAGWRTMLTQATVGGVFLGIIEGAGILISKYMAQRQMQASSDFSQYTPYESSAPALPSDPTTEDFINAPRSDLDIENDFADLTADSFEPDFSFDDEFDNNRSEDFSIEINPKFET